MDTSFRCPEGRAATGACRGGMGPFAQIWRGVPLLNDDRFVVAFTVIDHDKRTAKGCRHIKHGIAIKSWYPYLLSRHGVTASRTTKPSCFLRQALKHLNIATERGEVLLTFVPRKFHQPNYCRGSATAKYSGWQAPSRYETFGSALQERKGTYPRFPEIHQQECESGGKTFRASSASWRRQSPRTSRDLPPFGPWSALQASACRNR